MGFDLMGIGPKSKRGEYFRNNVWWWRGLWGYTCMACHDLMTPDQMQGGSFNDGVEIPAEVAIKIADRLEETIANKQAHAFSRTVKSNITKAKKNNADKKCGDAGYDWAEAYPFSVQNVRDFAKFCRESGGFSIC